MTVLSERFLTTRVLRAALACAMVGVAIPASAQLSSNAMIKLVGRETVATPAIKGTDSGYDPVYDVYLVVGSCYGGYCPGAYGAVYGIFVNRAGQAVTNLFSINPGASEGHFPRVRYAREINAGGGGFLVTWLEEGASGFNLVRARAVAFPGVLLGGVNTLSDGNSYAWIESAAAVGYSPVSQRFLVAWRTYPHTFSAPHLASRLVDITGVPVESVVTLSAGFGRDPGIAWNAASNLFGVSFSAENSSGSAGFSGFAIVPPVNGAAFSRNSFNQISGFTFITDVGYNPDTGKFVMVWHQNFPDGTWEVRMAEIDSSAQVVTTGLISRELPGYDAHSVAFNPVSRTFGFSSISAVDAIVAAELNSHGVRTSSFFTVGPGVTGRYPRISANTDFPDWDISFSNGFQSVVNLTLSTTSANGGPSGSNPPPDGTGGTGGGSTPTSGCTTPQPGADWVCVNGDWLPPSSGGTSTGGCTSPQPGADWVCVNGSWLPSGSGGTSGSTSSCTTPRPGSDWTCVNGNWLPPGSGGTSTGSCTTPQPGANWTCVNGNWLPPTTSCTTPQPGANWTCVNGNWLPPGSGGTPTGSCTTPQPGPNWVCVNGDWLPSSSTTTTSCTTPQPGANWSCVNGNWLPPTTSCTTPQPGPNWVCVNGDWLPSSSTSSCTTVQPGPGWTCVNGDWKPPSEP